VLAWFGYHKGYVDVRNPDGETLRKMADVAEDLHANVVDENDNVLVDPGGPEKPTWREPLAPSGSTAASVVGIVGLAIVAMGLAVVFWLLLRD
jgi:hypothetical protein